MPRITHRRAVGVVLATAAIAVGGTAYADDSPAKSNANGKTIRLLEAGKTIQPAFVDTGAPGLSPGDIVVVRDGVLREDGTPAGTFNQVCTLVKPAGNPFTSEYECVGSPALEDGTIAMQGPFVPATAEQTAAVTGGTGEYRTARGEVVIRSEADEIVVGLALLTRGSHRLDQPAVDDEVGAGDVRRPRRGEDRDERRDLRGVVKRPVGMPALAWSRTASAATPVAAPIVAATPSSPSHRSVATGRARRC